MFIIGILIFLALVIKYGFHVPENSKTLFTNTMMNPFTIPKSILLHLPITSIFLMASMFILIFMLVIQRTPFDDNMGTIKDLIIYEEFIF